MRTGIMQGRLLPPVEGRIQAFPGNAWDLEFALAEETGLDSIEWIYEVQGAASNPLATGEGIERIRALSARHQVFVRSVCADYFMDKPFLRATPEERRERLCLLAGLLERCGRLPVERVVLPFVDVSRIETDEEMSQVVALLHEALPFAEKAGIELHLESSLSPGVFAGLLERIPHPLVKVNYDTGNSASLGYRAAEEFSAYGERIGSVHIKDRLRGGGTVPLGTGDVDFREVFSGLKKIGYQRDFILQVARSVPGKEAAWALENLRFTQQKWQESVD